MGEETEHDSTLDSTLYLKEDRLKGRKPKILHTSFIKPSSATPIAKAWLLLCHLDFLWMAYYTPLLCTFTVDQVRQFGTASAVVQHLKDSLAETLVLFYPLAGRVVALDGPRRIHCNDAGAVFTEASVDLDVEDLRTEDFQPVPLLSGLAAAGLEKYPVLPEIATGIPALIIQVTHFKCGGIALAANWSHAVADGRSGFHFMKSWSEIARGLPVSLLPDHRRELVKPRDPLVPVDIADGVAFSPGARIAASQQSNLSSVTTPPEAKPNSNAKRKPKQITTQIVEFSKDEITHLRNPNPNLTRADCLSTHLWRTIVRARKLSSDARVRLWVIMEGRKKCSLPDGYFGNVTGMTPTITTVNELLNEPIGTTANLIHDAITSVSGEWFQGMVDCFASVKEGESLFVPKPLGLGTECGVSYLVRFPFYELDFGFGLPGLSTRNTMGAWDGLVFIVPSSRGEGHMVAMANLEPATASHFASMAHDLRD